MAKGFMYLGGDPDPNSRRTRPWRQSNSMDSDFCVEAPQEAIEHQGAAETFNTEQGSQFISEDFSDAQEDHGVDISMDAMGRWVDNAFVERRWRSVKYENINLRANETPAALAGVQPKLLVLQCALRLQLI